MRCLKRLETGSDEKIECKWVPKNQIYGNTDLKQIFLLSGIMLLSISLLSKNNVKEKAALYIL